MESSFQSMPRFPEPLAAASTPPAGPRWPPRLWLLAGLGLAATAGIVILVAVARGPGPERKEPPPRFAGATPHAINRPRTYPAERVRLASDAEVLGVSLNGKHRAYWLEAMGGKPTVHVVNDLLGNRPVSLAYCDRTGCVSAFTGPESQLLDLSFAGWRAAKCCSAPTATSTIKLHSNRLPRRPPVFPSAD